MSESNNEGEANVVDFKAEKQKRQPKVESNIGKLNPVRKVEGPSTIDLVNDKEKRIGDATYGLVTEPGMMQNVQINLNNRTEVAAMAAAEELRDTEVDPGAVREEIQEEITEQHLDAVLYVLLRKFGGDVYEAGKLNLHDGLFEKKSSDSKPEEGKMAKNFIIPLSGAGRMKELMSGVIPVSLGGGASFGVKPWSTNLLGTDGFTYDLRAKTPGGKDVVISVNFYYGVEEKVQVQTDTGEESGAEEEQKLDLAA